MSRMMETMRVSDAEDAVESIADPHDPMVRHFFILGFLFVETLFSGR